LAAHQELMIMRVSGANLWRLARGIVWGGVLLAVLAVLLGEFVAPSAKRVAETMRTQKMYAGIGALGAQGIWLKSGHDVVHISKVETADRLAAVQIYTLDAEGGLAAVRHAREVTFTDGHWALHDVHGTRFGADQTQRIQAAQM